MKAAGAATGGSGRGQALDLSRHMDKRVHVKLVGGRQVAGTLKGYDQLVNLVLDETVEYMRDPSDPYKESGLSRPLGLIVARGTSVMSIISADGMEEISNPFKT
ncbi:Sm-like protein LSM7 [Porphyridium purpureum]|uniref:Sm-like protein LSM7 n=1 Tax=Porphyridium purpureum TaxID=35688 RepID=A0A5J4Z1I1_PORPP|nr:Sm-like protein LSM7 [Porphyridium purpureum]|eukprot:POR3323..scf208_2